MSSGVTPLDRLLMVLRNPSRAAELASRADLWKEIVRVAEVHRLSGLLAHGVSQFLPPTERPWRDRVLMMHHRRHSHRLAALRRLTDAFQEAGITCVSLKGPLLAERFYPHPFLRPSSDLDLLIPEHTAGAAARLMGKLGFVLEGNYPWQLQRRVTQHLNFASTDRSPRVEIHYYLSGGGSSIAAAGFLERSVLWRSPSGFESRVMAPADESFYSCVHGARHAFHRLRWLYDALLIARSLSPEDRAGVRELTLHHGQTGHMVAANMAALEFLGESLELDCSGFPVPWLWTRLSRRHMRKMVERVEGNTSTPAEKLGYKLDLCRMAGSPLQAFHLLSTLADREIRTRLHGFLSLAKNSGNLARTLPD
jgi:hypothetical protein